MTAGTSIYRKEPWISSFSVPSLSVLSTAGLFLSVFSNYRATCFGFSKALFILLFTGWSDAG
jgi:hypothetical protein